MAYNHFYKSLDTQARKLFPSLKEIPEIAWNYLISPLEIQLKKSIYEQAEQAIQSLFSLSRKAEYARSLEPVPGISETHTTNRSVLMAYDFHTTDDGQCFLVEVNTNAAGYIFCALMEMIHRDSGTTDSAMLRSLGESFDEELKLFGRSLPKARIAIADDDIRGQKMFSEFLMYRDWFAQLGAQPELVEAKDFRFANGTLWAGDQALDLIYNRTTDFYFEDPAHQALRQAFLAQTVCISPQPREYWLLADKQRMVEWSQSHFMECASPQERNAISQVVLPTFDKNAFASKDEIWAQRKQLFFKPKRSHGGKSVYRGETVSRKVFERLMAEDILIQRFQPAARVPTEDTRSVLNNWKYDLRFFVYTDKIQAVAARIYQGQVTNFSSPMGGFTRVQFA